ncbi:MAG: winged helix-turn-helix domain-containing protein [Pseudomonadota bacterium]
MVIRVGDCEFHDNDRLLIRDNVRYQLQPRDHAVLRLLINNAPHVVPYEDILASVWRNKVVGDTVLYQSIGRLRRAFGDDANAPVYIQTLTKRGYRLLATVVATNAAGRDGQLAPLAILDFVPLSKGRTSTQAALMLAAELRRELVQREVPVMMGRARQDGSLGVDFEMLESMAAAMVLTGSVATDEAGVVRVQIDLYDVATRILLWSAHYDAEQPFTFKRQGEIAALIGDEVIQHR